MDLPGLPFLELWFGLGVCHWDSRGKTQFDCRTVQLELEPELAH